MAIASQKSTAYSTQASVEQLLEQISAKVRAQLNQQAQRQDIAPEDSTPEDTTPEDSTPKNLTPTVTESNHAAPGIKPQAKAKIKPDFKAEIRPEPRIEVYSEYPTNLGDVNIRQMAAEGYFQAIAHWLNERLVPQNVYAQVLADELPGRLRVLVEFERSPQPDRLIRLVCDRLYQLNSDVIEGVYLIVRALGAAKTDWEKAIRIPTATERQQSKGQLAQPAESLTKRPAGRPAAAQLVHESAASQRVRQVVRTQFKFFRAALVCGSAIAAFCFGSFAELILANRLSLPSIQLADDAAKSTPLPWYEEAAEPGFSPTSSLPSSPASSLATTVSFRPASRFQGRTVEGALETVAVIPHDQVASPSDPTVTLLFGGDISLNNFVFDDASQVDQLFSAVDIYRQADVAMVGLAEPLAYASTSLQEDFHHRTRPQAVEALQAGGIDLVGLASEGMMTYGTRGLEETLDNLDRHGIYHVGAGRDQLEAHRPEILEVKGQRVAYLGYNPEALTGAEGERAGVALASSENRQHIVDDIRAIRSQVDWIVVNYRWGDAVKNLLDTPEGQAEDQTNDQTVDPPKDWQRALAHEAVDAGADLVVGYYPNHIQGAEIYRDRPIAYSLGDADFDTASPKDHDTAALKVSLRNRQMKVEFLPITIHDAKLQMATGEQGKEILQTIRSASKTLEQPLRFPAVLKAGPEQLPNASQANTFTVPDKDDWVPKIQPDSPEPDNLQTDNLQTDNLQTDSPQLDGDNNVPPVNPAMKESDALFAPKPGGSQTDAPSTSDPAESEEGVAGSAVPYDKLDEQWQHENWKDNLLNETPPAASGETSGETWGQKQTESTPEFVPIPEGAIQRQSRGDEPELSSTDDPQTPSKTYPESYLESDPESSNFEAWKDPFAEDSHEEAPGAPSLPEQVNPGN